MGFHFTDEAISPPRQSFNVLGLFNRVSQSLPQPRHGIVNAMIEIHERVGRPQPIPQLPTGHYLAAPFRQNGKNGQGTSVDWQSYLTFAQFIRAHVKLENAETNYPAVAGGGRHGDRRRVSSAYHKLRRSS